MVVGGRVCVQMALHKIYEALSLTCSVWKDNEDFNHVVSGILPLPCLGVRLMSANPFHSLGNHLEVNISGLMT